MSTPRHPDPVWSVWSVLPRLGNAWKARPPLGSNAWTEVRGSNSRRQGQILPRYHYANLHWGAVSVTIRRFQIHSLACYHYTNCNAGPISVAEMPRGFHSRVSSNYTRDRWSGHSVLPRGLPRIRRLHSLLCYDPSMYCVRVTGFEPALCFLRREGPCPVRRHAIVLQKSGVRASLGITHIAMSFTAKVVRGTHLSRSVPGNRTPFLLFPKQASHH